MFALSLSISHLISPKAEKCVTFSDQWGVCVGVYVQFALTSVQHIPVKTWSHLKSLSNGWSCQLPHCYFLILASYLFSPQPCLSVRPLDIKYGSCRQRYAKCVGVNRWRHITLCISFTSTSQKCVNPLHQEFSVSNLDECCLVIFFLKRTHLNMALQRSINTHLQQCFS